MDILDEYDFIIGLEAAIQLEAVYHMTSHIVNIQPRSVPLFSNKNIKISPGTFTSIQLSGDLPCTFTSGLAIIKVQPVESGFSFNTIEVEFLDQSTCIHVLNKSNKGAALYQYQGSAFYIVGYNSKKLPKAVQNYLVTELELFGLVVNIYAFKQLLTNVYFEVFCDHSAIVQILNGKKKLPRRKIQRLIEHLLHFNFTVQYLPGNKMHITGYFIQTSR